jgi:hypothetical protein
MLASVLGHSKESRVGGLKRQGAYQLKFTYLSLMARGLEGDPLGDGIVKKGWRWMLDEEFEGLRTKGKYLWSTSCGLGERAS